MLHCPTGRHCTWQTPTWIKPDVWLLCTCTQTPVENITGIKVWDMINSQSPTTPGPFMLPGQQLGFLTQFVVFILFKPALLFSRIVIHLLPSPLCPPLKRRKGKHKQELSHLHQINHLFAFIPVFFFPYWWGPQCLPKFCSSNLILLGLVKKLLSWCFPDIWLVSPSLCTSRGPLFLHSFPSVALEAHS